MREHLFKAKRKDTGEWEWGYVAKYGYVGKEKTYIIPRCASALYAFEIDPETVCEFTGLTDKNGKKIFEGDICHAFYSTSYDDVYITNEVYFVDGSFVLRHNHNSYGCCAALSEHETFEVIGNVFDTPELLST